MKKTIYIILSLIIIIAIVCGFLWKLIEIWQSPEALSLIQAFLVIIYLTPLFYDVYCVLQTRKEKLDKILEGSDFRKIEEEIVDFDFYSVMNFIVDFIKYISTLLIAIMIGLLAFNIKGAPNKLYDIIHSATLIILIGLIAIILFLGIMFMYMSVIVLASVFKSYKSDRILRENNILTHQAINKILTKDALHIDWVNYKYINFILYKEGSSYGINYQRFEADKIKSKLISLSYSMIEHIYKETNIRNLIPSIGLVIYKDDIVNILIVPIESIIKSYTTYENLDAYFNDNDKKAPIKVKMDTIINKQTVQIKDSEILFYKSVNKRNLKVIK